MGEKDEFMLYERQLLTSRGSMFTGFSSVSISRIQHWLSNMKRMKIKIIKVPSTLETRINYIPSGQSQPCAFMKLDMSLRMAN